MDVREICHTARLTEWEERIEDKEFRDYERDIRRLYGVLFPKYEKILILGNKNDKIRVR